MIDKFISNIREFGLRDGFLFNLARILSVARVGSLYKYRFYAQPLSTTRRLPAHRGKTIETRWLKRGAPELKEIPRPTTVIEARFDQGGHCLAAIVDGRLVGCLWYVSKVYQEDEVRCDFDFSKEKDCIWDFDVYVDPGHRLGIVFMRLWDDTDSELVGRGYRWSLSRISAFNLHSIRSHERLGAVNVGSAVFLRLGVWQWSYSSDTKKIQFSSKDDDRPSIRIRLPDVLRSTGSE